jgi:hypothetical protein
MNQTLPEGRKRKKKKSGQVRQGAKQKQKYERKEKERSCYMIEKKKEWGEEVAKTNKQTNTGRNEAM